jgi:hypothetical protein
MPNQNQLIGNAKIQDGNLQSNILNGVLITSAGQIIASMTQGFVAQYGLNQQNYMTTASLNATSGHAAILAARQFKFWSSVSCLSKSGHPSPFLLRANVAHLLAFFHTFQMRVPGVMSSCGCFDWEQYHSSEQLRIAQNSVSTRRKSILQRKHHHASIFTGTSAYYKLSLRRLNV